MISKVNEKKINVWEKKRYRPQNTNNADDFFSYLGNDLKTFYKHGGYISKVAYTRDIYLSIYMSNIQIIWIFCFALKKRSNVQS